MATRRKKTPTEADGLRRAPVRRSWLNALRAQAGRYRCRSGQLIVQNQAAF